MGKMSARQEKLSENLGDGRRVSIDETPKNDAVFNDEQVALTVHRVHLWVLTGQEPKIPEGDDGWHAVAVNLRVAFAGDASPPPITPDQLTELVRNAYCRAMRIPTGGPLGSLPPAGHASWRAAALHGYNCVIADRESMRERPLAERERVMVQGARASL